MTLSFAAAKKRHLALGRRGERIAVAALRELGLEILATNYVGRHGEVDIVARHDGALCFVEVKTRRREILSSPAAAVGRDKRRRIARVARDYCHAIGTPPAPCRYDIVEVLLDGRRLDALRYWPHAFVPE